jgi:chromosome segregation ATPase
MQYKKNPACALRFTGIQLLAFLGLGACQTVYYGTMEQFGIEKRDILVTRVDKAREAQQEAKEQFASALDKFIAVTNYEGGDLEAQYNTLKDEYDDSVERAEEVKSRIDDVKDVADSLFAEWNEELGKYTDPNLRRASAQQLKGTQASYRKLITAMDAAEKKIHPVLNAFQDRVLFLKHNLNASAIASLRDQKMSIEKDISALIRDMNKSIAEADKFIDSMSKPEA